MTFSPNVSLGIFEKAALATSMEELSPSDVADIKEGSTAATSRNSFHDPKVQQNEARHPMINTATNIVEISSIVGSEKPKERPPTTTTTNRFLTVDSATAEEEDVDLKDKDNAGVVAPSDARKEERYADYNTFKNTSSTRYKANLSTQVFVNTKLKDKNPLEDEQEKEVTSSRKPKHDDPAMDLFNWGKDQHTMNNMEVDDSSDAYSEDGTTTDDESDDDQEGDNQTKVSQSAEVKVEADDSQEALIECPLVQDILIGIGPALKTHPGNQRMVAIIACLRDRFKAADEHDKRSIINEATSELHRGGTRFLKVNKSATGWTICSPKEIKQKVLECLLLGREDDAKQIVGDEATSSGSCDVFVGKRGASKCEALSSSSNVIPHRGRQTAGKGNLPFDPIKLAAQGTPVGLALTDFSQHGVGLLSAQPKLDLDDSLSSSNITIQRPGGLVQGPPLRTDVVIGREALLYCQEGNLHLQTLVQANVGQDIIPTEMKKLKAKGIFDRMVLVGTRFLMKEVDGRGLWYQLTQSEAQNVIYRGLCEEEKRIQTLLYASLPQTSATAGLFSGMEDLASSQHHLATASISRDNEPSRSGKRAGKGEETGPPKKKYRKRLRLVEERRRMALPTSKHPKKPTSIESRSGTEISRVSEILDSSDESTNLSDATPKRTILKGPVQIGPYDVILGRGRGSFNHPGNKNLINLFRRSKIPYGMASKIEKIRIARDVVTDIQNKGGRFLKRRSDDTWEIISNKDAYKKVGHGIRDLKEDDSASIDSSKSDVEDLKHVDEEATPCPKNLIHGAGATEDTLYERQHQVLENAKELEREQLVVRVGKSKTAKHLKAASNDRCYDEEEKKGVPTDEDASARFIGYGDGMQPRSIDVVCGRGKAFNRHPGNRKMYDAVTTLKYQYRDSTSQEEKSRIAHTVLRSIQDSGGKFLKYEESSRTWQELTYKNALKKIYHSIRDSLYNDRAANLNDDDVEVSRKSSQKKSETASEDIEFPGRSANIKEKSKNQHTHRSSKRDSTNFRAQQESRMLPGLIGDNMRSQLRGIVNHDARSNPHFALHECQTRASLVATNPFIQHQLVNMHRHSGPSQPWPLSSESFGAYAGHSDYDTAARGYHDDLRSAENVSARGPVRGMLSNEVQNAATRHHLQQQQQYLGMGRMGRY